MALWVLQNVNLSVSIFLGSGITIRDLLKGSFVQGIVNTPVPEPSVAPLLDYSVSLDDGNWHLYKSKVPIVEVDTHKVIRLHF